MGLFGKKLAIRTFHLQRDEDVHGVSGEGTVAQGVIFDDDTVAMRWLTETSTSVIFDSIEDVKKIHGHDGKTKVVFDDTGEVLASANDVFRKVVSTIMKAARVYYPDLTKDGKDTFKDVMDRIVNRPQMSVTELQDYLEEVGFDFDPFSHKLEEIR